MKGIYLVTDRGLCGALGLAAVVEQAARAGAACVQLREKTASTRQFIETAKQIRTRLAPFGIPLIINDRVDVALAAGADGVHVGQSDMPPGTARRLLGSNAIIGLSVETWADVEKAREMDVDYLGISPVFATSTKIDTQTPWGLDGVARIRKFTRQPLVAIGGLDDSNLAAVILAGADCIAAVSAICAAPDPFEATKKLKAAADAAFEKRKAT